jgi:hypothetical protein
VEKGIYSGMAHPKQDDDDRDLKGLRRANRDDEQHWRDKGWEKIEGGRDSGASNEANSNAPGDRPVIGADYTRSPFDSSLVRDEKGNLRDDRADVLHGYGEPIPEADRPRSFNRDDLENPNINPSMELPHDTTATFRILAIVLGLLLFGLVVAALYWNFLAPVKRAPETPNGKVQQQKIQHRAALEQFATFVNRMNERR